MKVIFFTFAVTLMAFHGVVASSVDNRNLPESALNEQLQEELNKQLRSAAHDGNLDEIRKLVAKGAKPNSFDDIGHAAIHVAALAGQSKVIELLVNTYNVDVNSKTTENGMTALHVAAQMPNSAETIETLKNLKADFYANAEGGFIPLHRAVNFLHVNTIKKFLDVDPKTIHIKNDEDYTPLDAALSWGNPKVLKELISVPTEEIKKWRSGIIDHANLVEILQTVSLSEAEIQADEKLQKIKTKFVRLFRDSVKEEIEELTSIILERIAGKSALPS